MRIAHARLTKTTKKMLLWGLKRFSRSVRITNLPSDHSSGSAIILGGG